MNQLLGYNIAGVQFRQEQNPRHINNCMNSPARHRTCHTDSTVEFEFSVAVRPQKPPYGLLGTGSPGRPPPLSHSIWALNRDDNLHKCVVQALKLTDVHRLGFPTGVGRYKCL